MNWAAEIYSSSFFVAQLIVFALFLTQLCWLTVATFYFVKYSWHKDALMHRERDGVRRPPSPPFLLITICLLTDVSIIGAIANV